MDDNFVNYVKIGFEKYDVPQKTRDAIEHILSSESKPKFISKQEYNKKVHAFQTLFRSKYAKRYGRKYGDQLTVKEKSIVKAMVYKLDKSNCGYEEYLNYIFDDYLADKEKNITIGQACSGENFKQFSEKRDGTGGNVEIENEENSTRKLTDVYNRAACVAKYMGNRKMDIKALFDRVKEYEQGRVTLTEFDLLVKEYEVRYPEAVGCSEVPNF